MYTKNAFKNLRNRYKAVLKKCTLLNTFGSLALASAFFVASAIMPSPAYASTVQETDAYLIEEYVSGTSYYKTYDLKAYDSTTDTITTKTYGILLKTSTGITSTMEDLLTAYLQAETSTGTSNPYSSIKVEDGGTFSFQYTDESGNMQTLSFNVYDENGSIIQSTTLQDNLTGNLSSNFIGITSTDTKGGVMYNTLDDGFNITGDFIGNYLNSSDYFVFGGAILNANTAAIGDISGSFIGNYASTSGSDSDRYASGGAIYNNLGTINTISAAFIGNYTSASGSSSHSASGGAIYNNGGTIGAISSSFIGNYASASGSGTHSAYGGAIYNAIGSMTTSTIGDISGSFIGNYASASGSDNLSASGGAIYNDMTSTIGNISAAFIGNYASTSCDNNEYVLTNKTQGGAIYNRSIIGDISGIFIENYASTSVDDVFSAEGGAIYNHSARIGDISASFIGNYATSSADSAYGGAIYNNNYNNDISGGAQIGTISGSFIDNYVSGTTSAYGGAIYNDYACIIGDISASFIGNYATSSVGSAYGGAIYSNNSSLTFLANNATYLFTDNYTLTGTTKDYNFIATKGGTLTFNMTGTGGFVLNDSILPASIDNETTAYTLAISGESKDNNIFSLNDEISGFSTFNVTNATLSLGSYDHGDSTTRASFVGEADSTMTFTNANLRIDTLAFDGIKTGTAVINGNDTITLTADTNSILSLANTSAHNTYTIAENFVSGTTLWTTDNVLVINALLEATNISGNATDSAYMVTVGINPESAIYNTPTAGLLLNLASSEFYVPNSTNTGARFIYNVMDNLDTSIAQKIQLVEGAVQMGAVAGVQKGLASTISSANTVLDTRMLNANSINPSSTAMRVVDENGHVSVYNNITTLASNGYNPLSSPQNYTEIWLMPMYAHEKVSGVSSGNFSNTGYKSDMYGVALGIDRTYQDKYRIGLAFDMGSGSSESNGDYATTENDYDFFGFTAYGSVRFDKLSILGSMGYTKNDSEVAQNLSAYGLNNLYSDIKSDVWNFNLKAEYNYAFGQGYTLSPYVGVQYMSMSTDDYKVKDSNSIGSGDSGSSLGGDTVFNVKSDRQDVFSFPIGVALSKEIHTENGWDFTPKVNAGVIFATGDLYATSVSSIPDIDASSSMSLKVIDNTTLDLGLGLSASKNNFTMMLDYDFQHSEHRTAHGVMAKVVFKF